MRILKLRVKGFQSFSDSGEIEFEDGFNLVIGQNNSGKSALLRAMLPSLKDERHRSLEQWENLKLPHPEVEFELQFSGKEVADATLRAGNAILFPIHESWQTSPRARFDAFLENPSIVLAVAQTPTTTFRAPYPSHALFAHGQNQVQVMLKVEPRNGSLDTTAGPIFDSGDNVAECVWRAWNDCMFYFAAERFNVGECGVVHAPRLEPNAANLPAALNTLAGEKGDTFEKLVNHAREIFPTVGNLSVRVRPENGNLEIRVWPTRARPDVDLSFPLHSSGTGVAQVIAILTAIMTVDDAVIIIDEINSFLHPAAVKALLRILQTEYPRHQYIISTHAPEVIGFSHPRTVHLVNRNGYESSVRRLDLANIEQFREVAGHLGISMADVFAADRVIWVEGPTEEISFPFIYQAFAGQPLPQGTLISSVAATGDFNRKRDREIVYEVYRRLSGAASPLVVATTFSFDSETLSEVDKAKMVSDAAGQLSFLPRRHIECYLLAPDAIAAFIAERDPKSEEVATPQAVGAKLDELAGTLEFKIPEWAGDRSNPAWLAGIDAAKLIARTVAMLTDQRVTFNKKEDSLTLIQHIVTSDKEALRPLFEYVAGLVQSVSAD